MKPEETQMIAAILAFWKSEVAREKSSQALIDYAENDMRYLLSTIARLERELADEKRSE